MKLGSEYKHKYLNGGKVFKGDNSLPLPRYPNVHVATNSCKLHFLIEPTL